jgi:hypothetical protein
MDVSEDANALPKQPRKVRARSRKLWKRRPYDWTFVIGIASIALSLTSVIIAYLNLSRQLATVGGDVRRVEAQVLNAAMASQFLVTHPSDDSVVSLTEIARGVTPYAGLHHYVVVTPLNDGGDWIQSGPVTVVNGIWVSRATFGSTNAGIGEQFLIRGLASRATLPPGRMGAVPTDAVLSNPITVTRTR